MWQGHLFICTFTHKRPHIYQKEKAVNHSSRHFIAGHCCYCPRFRQLWRNQFRFLCILRRPVANYCGNCWRSWWRLLQWTCPVSPSKNVASLSQLVSQHSCKRFVATFWRVVALANIAFEGPQVMAERIELNHFLKPFVHFLTSVRSCQWKEVHVKWLVHRICWLRWTSFRHWMNLTDWMRVLRPWLILYKKKKCRNKVRQLKNNAEP